MIIFNTDGNGFEQCGRNGCDSGEAESYDARTLLENSDTEKEYAREISANCVNIFSLRQYLFISSIPEADTSNLEIWITQLNDQQGIQVLNNGRVVGDSDHSNFIVTILGSEQLDSYGNVQWPMNLWIYKEPL